MGKTFRLIVAVQDKIDVYDFITMHMLFTIDRGDKDSKFALSLGAENSYFAHAASNLSGEIMLYDLMKSKVYTTISAHRAPIMQMTFNQSGTLLATTSTNV